MPTQKFFLSIFLSALWANNAIALDSAKFSADDVTKDVVVQERSALCVAGNTQPRHVYDLKKLTQQLKQLPTVLTLKIIQLSEASKTSDIFSFSDDDYKDLMSREYAIGTEDYLLEDSMKKVLLSMKGKEASDANLLHICDLIGLEKSCKLITDFHIRFLGFNDTEKKSLVKDLRPGLSDCTKPTLQVSRLNRAVFRTLLQSTKTEEQQTLSTAAFSQPKAKRKREEKEIVIRRSARIAEQQKRKNRAV